MADADAAAAAEAVREAATEILLIDHDGQMEEALARARALMLAHQDSPVAHRLLGELHYAAAVRAAAAAAAASSGDGVSASESRGGAAAAAAHLRVARDALAAARRLAPSCVDVAAALGDAFAASRMYGEAESEFRRARSIPDPTDPALTNAAYGMYEGYEHERDPAFAAERVEEARERARASYARMTVEELVPMAARKVLDTGRLLGAAEGRKSARLVAKTFPNLGRAQHLQAYMDLEFVRSLDAAIDKRPFLRRTLAVAERAAAFPRSPVIASFHGRLLFVLGEYDAAERECRRALDMKEPDDPQLDCIPPGSIGGENRGARLVSLACEFHELLNKILVAASDYWDSMSGERQRDSFLRVRFGVLEDEYRKVDLSYAFAVSDVRSFVNEHKVWRFWVCPICDRKKFVDSGLLLSHMCSKHPRAVLPRLQSLLDQTIDDRALLECDDSLGGVTFSEDAAEQDMVCFNKSSGVFKWLFYAPSSGVGAKPFAEVREQKREKGCMFLDSIKDKMKTLPADKSSTEFSEALPRIQELWHEFLKASVFDYRGAILTLARSFLWRELKKSMTEDPELAAKRISATDIDAVFTKEIEPSHAEEDHETGDNIQPSQEDGALMVSEDHDESDVYVKDESSEKLANNMDSSDLAVSVAESKNDLDAKLNGLDIDPKISEINQQSEVRVEYDESSETPTNNTESSDLATSVAASMNGLDATLDKLDIDSKVSENNQESEVQVEGGESSEAMVTNTELSDPAINITESRNGLDMKLENLQINSSSNSSIETPGASSGGQNGQQD
ncbi:unnamed protein product [Urochloa decumbens]|uniref:DUF629 domain-containing protein n=1 Tax=Urochloa decumbens TaxID=240449 RepID=A0ABC9B353_9POAL